MYDIPLKNNAVDLDLSVFPNGGVAIPDDLTTLVEAIYVSPGAPPWFEQLIEITLQRFGATFPVKQSRLDEDPIF